MVDYTYYRLTYGGDSVTDESHFNRLLLSNKALLGYHTFGRYSKVEDEDVRDMVKFTLCQLIDLSANMESEGNLKSETLDDMSYTYSLTSASDFKSKQSEIIQINLAHTGLLYRGVGRRNRTRWF